MSAETKIYRLAIIGDPVSHSLSPVLHQVFLNASGLEGEYEKIAVAPDKLAEFFSAGNLARYDGFNITVPHKVNSAKFLSELSPAASAIEAVNTVTIRDGKVYGDNTDVAGFERPLKKMTTTKNLSSGTAVLLGIGGASRAVVYSLLSQSVSKLVLVARNPVKLQSLMTWANRLTIKGSTQIEACLFDELGQLETRTVQLVVNATPLGMSGQVDKSPVSSTGLSNLPKTAVAYDLIYTPLETLFLKQARELGLKTQDGLDMLVIQGAEAFQRWTGITVDEDTLTLARNTLLETLKSR